MNSVITFQVIALLMLTPFTLATEDAGLVYCTAPVEGDYSDNLLGAVQVATEAACEAECDELPECNFFTYHYGNSSTFPDTCSLLTELREPITHCEDGTCISGSPNCDQNLCGFLDDGSLYLRLV